MFKKLNISLSEIDISKIQRTSEYTTPTFKEFSIDNKNYILDILSNKIRFAIAPYDINITEILYPGVRPHKDSWPTSINFYFDAGTDETCFWKEVEPSTSVINGPTPFNNIDNLEKIDSFVANKGEGYLLDVGSIHSVKMNTPNTKRHILRLLWYKYSFTQILHSFKILNG